MESRAGDRLSRHGRTRQARIVLAVCVLAVTSFVHAADGPQRAFWMPQASLESVDGVRRALGSASTEGFDTILVPVSLAPDLPGSSFDGIAETLREARARNLRVHAWLDVVRAAGADELPAARDHILYLHPEWLMVPRDLAVAMFRVDLRSPEYIGRLARWTRANAQRVDGLYVSPLHSEAIAYLAERVTTVLGRYPVEGVHLDAIRFPDPGFDYGSRALDLFRTDVRRGLDAAARARMDQIEAIDPFAYPEEFPGEWQQFRQARLTTLVTTLRNAIRTVRPDAFVSVGVTLEADLALRDHLQDWRAWVESRFIDAIARADAVSRAVVFSYENLRSPLAPVVTASRSTATGGSP
jgi:uncharacterized lipoprotein YddW (UPF0748 family)